VIGNNLQSCREALISNADDGLHLLERINIELQVENSIVPTAYNIARFKITGKLPSLKANLSDMKYKSLMRLIDVCIPKFDGDEKLIPPSPTIRDTHGTFQGLFRQKGNDYTVPSEVDDEERPANAPQYTNEPLFRAEGGNVEVCAALHTLQHNVTCITFSDLICANISSN
jgi:vacuolar protein sorting-associated protein 13A/C